MDVWVIKNHLKHFSFMSLLYCYTTARIAWLSQQHKKMLEQTRITYNEVCNFYHSSKSWVYPDFFVKTKTKTKTFSSRPRSRPRLLFQDQNQDHFYVLEVPQDQDQGLETTSLTHMSPFLHWISVKQLTPDVYTRSSTKPSIATSACVWLFTYQRTPIPFT